MQKSLHFLRANLERLNIIQNPKGESRRKLEYEIKRMESYLERIHKDNLKWIAYPPGTSPDEAVAEIKVRLKAKKKELLLCNETSPTIDNDQLLELLEDLEAQKISKAKMNFGDISIRIHLVIFDDKLRISLATESSSEHETLDELTLKKLRKLGFSPQHSNIDLPINGDKNKQEILQTLAALLIDVLKVDMNDTILVAVK